MRLKSKIDNWVKADFISGPTADKILDFERQKLEDKLQNSLKYAAFFAILLGISLIIAANWDALGLYFKLGAHVIINTALVGLIWHWRDNKAKSHYREVAVYFFCGLTLTLLALIGQSFQLQGDIGGLLLLWLGLITGVVIIIGQNKRVVSLWIAGFLVTLFYNIEKIVEIDPEYIAFFSTLSLALFSPLLGYIISQIKQFKTLNPHFSIQLQSLSIASSILMAFAASLFFYVDYNDFRFINDIGLKDYNIYLGIITLFYFTIMLLAKKLFPNASGIPLFTLTGLFILIPLFVMIEMDIFSALHFIAFALILAILAIKNHNEILLSLCLFAISIRLFIIFLELFGTMLLTGWGLIISGLLLLTVLKGTNIIRKKLMGGIHVQ